MKERKMYPKNLSGLKFGRLTVLFLDHIDDKGNQTLSGSSSDATEVKSTQNTSGTNKQVLSESTTFTSTGDIGIQTPAYAITEWRKVLININQMIIDECNDLFLKLY